MKKIDKLLLSSFLPPFVVTFFIALFVLIMQTLWVYIDDIIGKGAGFGMILEFIFYRSISLFPMAFPIAILISSVMVMGNLSERYELASMKSAGVPLLRTIRALILASVVIGFCSWVSSNYLIPRANLKFKSRLYDMRNQKPTLNLEEGVFNDDFDGYQIRIGEKNADNRVIKDVFIANHATGQRDNLNEIIAADGEMYTASNERYLIMELKNGEQFQEGNRYVSGSRNKAPFVRTSFDRYIKIFDMNEFEINRTDEELFQNHYSMLSMRQLREAIDSIDLQIDNRKETMNEYVNNYLINHKTDTLSAIEKLKKDSINSIKEAIALQTKNRSTKSKSTEKQNVKASKPKKVIKNRMSKSKKTKKIVNLQKITKDLKEYNSILETFPNFKQQALIDKSLTYTRSIKSHSDSALRFLDKTKEKRVKHIFELYSKYSFAVVCVVFLFIGAPMGSIVRKGGFGYPLLIAIICFMLFIVLTMVFKDMAEAFVIHPILAVWMPNLLLLPVGIFLTYKAMNDSKLNFGWIAKIFELMRRVRTGP